MSAQLNNLTTSKWPTESEQHWTCKYVQKGDHVHHYYFNGSINISHFLWQHKPASLKLLGFSKSTCIFIYCPGNIYLCSWRRRMNIMKITLLSKAICRLNAISIKFPMAFLTELEQKVPQFVCKPKDHKYPKKSWERKMKLKEWSFLT